MNIKNEFKQFNLLKIILYHLLPGIPTFVIVLFLANPTWGLGLPMFLSLMLAMLFGLIPTQLIILKIFANKEKKKIREIIGYNKKMPISKIIIWTLPVLIFSVLIFATISNIELSLWDVPNWFIPGMDSFEISSTSIDWLMIILGLLINGLLGPIVEEIYFRGFLLPRMERYGKLAPLFNTTLFSIYHFFSPWELITRIIADAPFIYAVWYKKNIKIGIYAHCAMNFFSMVAIAIMVLV